MNRSNLDTRRPFTTVQAMAAGISMGEIRGPAYRTIFRGVHIAGGVPLTTVIRCEVALTLHPRGAVIAGLTAAELLDLPTPRVGDIHLSVGRPGDRRSRPGPEGLMSSVHARRPGCQVVAGLRVATGADLFVQLARRLSLVDLVVLGDALIRRKLATPEEIVIASAAYKGDGALAARAAAGLVRPDVDSPMETRVRLLLVFAGFPEPGPNAISIGNYRPDLCWPELHLIVEYDGRQHREDLDQWDHDIARLESIGWAGWSVVTVVARGVYQRPDETIDRVYRAYVAAGGRPFVINPAWRTHFPPRRAVA